MGTQFGDRIKQLREQGQLLQRQVAAMLEIDTPMLSKIERGERVAKKEMVPLIAEILNGDKDELLTLWLADQLFTVIEGEPLASEALKIVTKQINRN